MITVTCKKFKFKGNPPGSWARPIPHRRAPEVREPNSWLATRLLGSRHCDDWCVTLAHVVLIYSTGSQKKETTVSFRWLYDKPFSRYTKYNKGLVTNDTGAPE